jgi:hypothetical protein
MESAAWAGLFLALLLGGLTVHNCLLPLALWLLHVSFLQLNTPLQGGISKCAHDHSTPLLQGCGSGRSRLATQ